MFVDRGGKVGGDVETVNGAIGLVDTDVGGGIETVNGDVTVGAGSHVAAASTYEKPNKLVHQFGKPRMPRIVIGPNARGRRPAGVRARGRALYVHATRQDRPGHRRHRRSRFDTPTPPPEQ